MKILEPVPCRYQGTTVVEFGGSQKLYADFWTVLGGGSAPQPCVFQGSAVYIPHICVYII